jgi:hypothetical protein
MSERFYTIVDHQEMPLDVSLTDFLYNISAQVPGDLMLREGQTVTLKIKIEDKKE